MRSLLLCAGVSFGVFVGGCLSVDLPDDAVFFCDSADDCPAGTECNLDVGRCLQDDVERDAPTLAVTPTTQRLRPPSTLTVTRELDVTCSQKLKAPAKSVVVPATCLAAAVPNGATHSVTGRAPIG